jgi:hypothetical protein
MSKPSNAVTTVDQFIAQVGALTKKAEALGEPGSIGGATAHPVKDVDGNLHPVTEGERSKENSKDVKDMVGPKSVENASEPKTAAERIRRAFAGIAKFAEGNTGPVETGTKVTATGEDPASETESAKAGKEDKQEGGMGGTTHPASTENNELDSHKYAGDLTKLAGLTQDLGNSLLTDLHAALTKTAAATTPSNAAATGTKTTKTAAYEVDPSLAYYAGSELASIIAGNPLDKKAADAMVEDLLAGIVKQAADDADMFITYAQEFVKASQDPAGMPPELGGATMPPEAAGGGGMDPAAMLGATGGAAAQDPAAAGGGEGGEAEAEQLAAILAQLGITPEQAIQAIMADAEGGGAGGGLPGGGLPGGGAPDAAAAGMEAQAAAGKGKQVKVAQAEIKEYLTELISRSNRK